MGQQKQKQRRKELRKAKRWNEMKNGTENLAWWELKWIKNKHTHTHTLAHKSMHHG